MFRGCRANVALWSWAGSAHVPCHAPTLFPATLPLDSGHTPPLSFLTQGVRIGVTVFSHHAGGG